MTSADGRNGPRDRWQTWPRQPPLPIEGSAHLNELTGPQRAAVILLALGAEHGAAVWKMLDEDEIRTVSIAMSQLGIGRRRRRRSG